MKIFGINRLFNLTSSATHKYPILTNSIPKCGSHLIKNIISGLPGIREEKGLNTLIIDGDRDRLKHVEQEWTNFDAGAFYWGHYSYSNYLAEWFDKNRVKQIFIYRDPRDYTVSLYHYIMKDVEPRHPYFHMLNKHSTDSARLLASISGIGEGKNRFKISSSSLTNVRLMFESFVDWMKDKNTIAIRYEDLIDKNINEELIINVMKHLELNLTDKQIRSLGILKRGLDPQKSLTYRKGVSGSWRDEYKSIHVDTFRSVFGEQLLENLGYDW